jgi:hypothetical protein
MPDQHDRSRSDVDRADRQVIQQAATRLRQSAIRAGYAGLEHKHLAFALALVLDELRLHLRENPIAMNDSGSGLDQHVLVLSQRGRRTAAGGRYAVRTSPSGARSWARTR